MRNLLFVVLTFLCIIFIQSNLFSQNYDEIWSFINKNERYKAFEILDSRINSNTATIDEFITWYYLKMFDGKEDEILNFLDYVKKSDRPDAYIYSLWFNHPVVGNYGEKEPHQMAMLQYLIGKESANGTLRAAAHYSLAHHYSRTHQFDKIKAEEEKIGGLIDWQMVGPFYNISGSGFNKNYGPIHDPSDQTVFTSSMNAPIKWFTPIEKQNDGWIFTGYYTEDNTASVSYAQTFVNSPIAQEVYLCTGLKGTIKVWVNDQLIIKVPEERITEMDSYNSKCHLNAGTNRIVVQSGSEDDESNFIIRLTDTHYNPIPNLKFSTEAGDYKKASGENLSAQIPLFAETYFIEKIKSDPDNLINHILLTEVYLRNKKVFDARVAIEKGLALSPDNSILKYLQMRCYLEDNNRTKISELMEYFLEHDPNCLLSLEFRASELSSQEKYQEALETIKQEEQLYGSDEDNYNDLIEVYGKLDKMNELIEVINEAYTKYPKNERFVGYAYYLEKQLNKNPKKALKILEDFNDSQYSYTITKALIEEYYNAQNYVKPSRLIQEMIDTWPYSAETRIDQLNEHLGFQRYDEALKVCDFLLKLKPYSGQYYNYKAYVLENQKKEKEAIESYRMSLRYKPTLYESRDKMLHLEKKDNLLEMFSADRIEELIKTTGKNINLGNHDYYYIQDETTVMLYPEGGKEEVHIYAIKILNERGIDRYSDLYLPYNSYTESLLIENAELIKSNGNKIKPETSDNHVVWTGLEPGDIIYCKYKIRSYHSGKFAYEFYDRYHFEGSAPSESSRYTLIIPATREFKYEIANGAIEYRSEEKDGYKIYTWEKSDTSGVTSEPYMPPTSDVSTTLHLSTIKDWNEIATWYSDVVYSKIASESDYEVAAVFHQIFQGNLNLNADQKAKMIYEYIAENISYSSVSFRQSDLIPQKASKTLSTRLGDCKDISTLFVSLANLCGLKSNLVLISTRDNGKKEMLLPSFHFNHCIVKYTDDKGQDIFLELTDRNLPFKSLPPHLFEALSLVIPSKDETKTSHTLSLLNPANKTPDRTLTKTTIQLNGNDINVVSTNTKYGSLSGTFRNTYRSLSKEKINQERHDAISSQFTNSVKINDIAFEALYECVDSVSVTTNMSIQNEVKKIGSVYALPITHTDVIFTAAPFNLTERKYDFEYWEYENADEYESQIEIILPADKTFVDIPKNESFIFRDISYSISYSLSGSNKMNVVRKAKIMRNNISSSDYAEFRSFVMNIIAAEGAYITFK